MTAAIWHRTQDGQTSGSYLQGEVYCSYATLVKVFGEPHTNGDGGYKVRVQSSFQVGRYVITIYDWKCEVPVERNQEWHIGGFDSAVVDLVHKKLKRIAFNRRVSDGGTK